MEVTNKVATRLSVKVKVKPDKVAVVVSEECSETSDPTLARIPNRESGLPSKTKGSETLSQLCKETSKVLSTSRLCKIKPTSGRLKDRNAGKAVMLLPMVEKLPNSGPSIFLHQSIKVSLRRSKSK